MTRPPSAVTEQDRTDPDTWPWRCLNCGGTIFHDGEHCRDCRTSRHHSDDPSQGTSSEGFLAWIRRESFATFSLKVTLISGIELALTALWLRLLLLRSIDLATVGLPVS